MTEQQPVSEASVPEESWIRFHKATPWLSVWQVWAAIGAFIVSMIINMLDSDEGITVIFSELFDAVRSTLVWILLGILVLTVLGIVASRISWKRKAYAFVPSGIHYREGVFSKKHRHVRWDRIQSVDLKSGIIPRIFGLGSLDVQSASGGSGTLSLGLLRQRELTELRHTILSTARQARENGTVDLGRPATLDETLASVDDLSAPQTVMGEREIYRLGAGRLALMVLCSAQAFFAVLILTGVIVGSLASDGLSFFTIIVALPALTSLWSTINSSWGHRIHVTDDGLQVTRGLTKSSTVTYRPSTFHAFEAVQPLFWRPFGYWRLTLTVAGGFKASNVEEAITRDILIPAGSRDEVLSLMWMIAPDMGVEDPVGFLAACLEGESHPAFTPAPRQAKKLDPFGQSRRAFVLTPTLAVGRTGSLAKAVVMVRQGHWQGLGLRRGPLQSKLGLATFIIAVIPGLVSWKVKNLAEADVIGAVEPQLALGQEARLRGDETHDMWKERVR